MFEEVNYLYFLALVPIFVVIFVWRGITRANILRSIGDKELIESLSSQVSPFRRQLKKVLWLFALASVIFAMARPVWGVEEEIIRTEGLQIIVAMDISRSMDAIDVSPSRLERARFDLLSILGELQGNDIGIVLFAQDAFVYMPMTYDFRAVEIFMNDIETSMMTRQGTNIPAAIELAMRSFDTTSNAQRVMLLVSDGESHEGDAISAAQLAAEERVVIYTLGYGTQAGANIPIYNINGDLAGYQTEGDTGSLITTVLNSSLLQGIASTTQGFYVPGGVDMLPLITDIQNLQTGSLGDDIVTRPIERFSIFVALAVMVLSIEMLLPETRREGDEDVR